MFNKNLHNLHIEVYGPWAAEIRKLELLPSVIKPGMMIGQRKAAERLMKIVKGHIRNQDMPFKKHGTRYAKQKAKHGHGTAFLLSTGSYLNAIDTWQADGVRYVGVRHGNFDREAFYKSKGKRRVSISKVAMWNEQGTPFAWPRPVWKNSLAEMGGEKGFRDIITDSIFTNLVNKGYDVKRT